MKNNKAINHHFIPVHYQKGFCNSNGDLFIYNKEHKKINTSPKKPAQLFYERDLHTVKLFGEKILLIEEAYSMLEDKFSQVIEHISPLSSQDFDALESNQDWANILTIMTSIQFWRNPSNIHLADEKSNYLLDLFDSALPSNYEVIPFTRETIKHAFKKRKTETMRKLIQFFVLPLITFKFNGVLPREFKVIRTSDYNYGRDLILSDNPIHYDSMDENLTFLGEFYFPLSKNIVIARSKTQGQYDFDRIQALMIGGARSKLAGSSVDLLEYFHQKI